MTNWNIGCSGFHYDEWKNIFYPEDLPKSKWFEFYSEHFNTIELNVTFYRFPRIEQLENLYKKSPSSFSFSIKAPRLITHFKKFNDVKRLLSDFYGAINKGLKDKAGGVLFQLPSSLVKNEKTLNKIVKNLDKNFNNVVEFRDSSWWDDEVFEELNKHSISFCGISHPDLPDKIIKTSPVLYYRFHGTPDLYQSPYKKTVLKDTVNKIKKLKDIRQVFIYFNNTMNASAIKNAKQIITLASH